MSEEHYISFELGRQLIIAGEDLAEIAAVLAEKGESNVDLSDLHKLLKQLHEYSKNLRNGC